MQLIAVAVVVVVVLGGWEAHQAMTATFEQTATPGHAVRARNVVASGHELRGAE